MRVHRRGITLALCALGLIALGGCLPDAGPRAGLPAQPLAARPAATATANLTTASMATAMLATDTSTAAEVTAAAATARAEASPTLAHETAPSRTTTARSNAPGSGTGGAQNPPQSATAAPRALSPEQWKQWPVMPSVPEEMRAVYQRGLAEGRRAGAFSILGDCQSQPEVFLGIFDSDPNAAALLPESIQATTRQFRGSFDRYSPTVKDGTTEGALLWIDWNDNKEKKCARGETPLECELRVQQPSIVFIHVGTHWEARQERYMRRIIERILEFGAVPVMVTKADNRELDERINANLVRLAAEYHLPVWNFWRSVQNLPNQGMEPGSDMYLSPEGLKVHRLGGIQALDAVWRGLSTGGND